MFSMLRSDWFLTMVAGFAIGGLCILLQQPALALVP
jgi:hypothetical protein